MKILEILKSIKFESPPKADLVLWDGHKLDVLDRVFLHNFDYTVLYTRREKIYFSFALLFSSLKYIKFFSFRKHRGLVYYLACLDQISPKVVLTYTFTNQSFDEFIKKYSHARFVTIQNGTITDHDSSILKNRIFDFLFLLGDFQYQLFKKYQSQIKEPIISGSLVAGFYKKNIKLNERKKVFKIGIISQYTEDLFLRGYDQAISENFILILQLVRKFLNEEKMKTAILMRSNENPNEIRFFDQYFGPEVERVYPVDDFSNYQNVESCEVLIGLDSTLTLESLDLGAKVLFVACNNFDQHKVVENHFFSVKENNYSDFKNKIQALLLMNKEEYLQTHLKEKQLIVNHENVKDGLCFEKVTNLLIKLGVKRKKTLN